jgi:hypothetical protein
MTAISKMATSMLEAARELEQRIVAPDERGRFRCELCDGDGDINSGPRHELDCLIRALREMADDLGHDRKP